LWRLQILSRKANEATALRAVDALRFLVITSNPVPRIEQDRDEHLLLEPPDPMP